MSVGKRLRVAMVHGPGPPRHDGVSDYVAQLLRALPDVGVNAVSVPVRPTPPDGASWERRSVPGRLAVLGPVTAHGRWLTATVDAATAIRRLRPDLVHVQFAPSAYRFSALPGLLPVLLRDDFPLVTTVHEYGWWAAPGWVPHSVWRPLEARVVWDRETGRLVPASDAVIVTNPEHAARVETRTGRQPVEIPLAPNVVPPASGGTIARPPRPQSEARSEARSELVRQRLGLPAAAFLLVFFGFVHPVKGIRYVLEALPKLRTTRQDLCLVVIGGFTSQALPADEAMAFRAELESLADRHGVTDGVRFTGHLPAPKVSELLYAADAAVLPYTAGVNLKSGALLAALAHGLPTAVTLTDDPDGRLRDGVNVAVITARRDAGAIVDSLRPLVRDAGLRARLSANGRALVAGRSWSELAIAHRTVYERVIRNTHAGR